MKYRLRIDACYPQDDKFYVETQLTDLAGVQAVQEKLISQILGEDKLVWVIDHRKRFVALSKQNMIFLGIEEVGVPDDEP